MGEKGISVISDVLDTKELLKNTFTREFRVVPGIPWHAFYSGSDLANTIHLEPV